MVEEVTRLEIVEGENRQLSTDTNPVAENMQALLDNSEVLTIRRGEIVRGVVMRVGQEGLLVSVGHKSEGIVPPGEMQSLRKEELASINTGDEILARVLIAEGDDGSCILSVDQAREEVGWQALKQNLDSGEWVDGVVVGHNRGGILVDVEGLSGFVPISHVGGLPRGNGSNKEEELASRIGETLHLKVIELDRARKRAIFSEKMVLQEQREQDKERILDELQENEVRKGRISGISEFGAFVDLGGADGLIHISELSWEPVQSPEDVVKIDDEVEVYVMKVDRETKRIALSLRRIGPQPWDTIAERYQVDQTVMGTITKLTGFGAFARIEGSVEGLIHISELSNKLIQHPKEVVKEGEVLPLKILKIEPERKRLALSLKQAEAD